MYRKLLLATMVLGMWNVWSDDVHASYYSIANGFFVSDQTTSYEGAGLKVSSLDTVSGWTFTTTGSSIIEEEPFWSSQNLTTLSPQEKILTPDVFGFVPPDTIAIADTDLICLLSPPKNTSGNATGVHMYTQKGESDILTTKELQINGIGGGENLEYTLSFDLLKEYTGTRSFGSTVDGVQNVNINNLTVRNVDSNVTLTVSLLTNGTPTTLFSGGVKSLLSGNTNTIMTNSFWLDSSNAADYYQFRFAFSEATGSSASYMSMTNVSLNRVVPEPQTCAMLLGACAVGIVWKCRKRIKIHL